MKFRIDVECPNCGIDTSVEIEVQNGNRTLYIPTDTSLCIHCNKPLSVEVDIDIKVDKEVE